MGFFPFQAPGGAATVGELGTGSDGAVTLDGVVTPAWTSLAGSTYSLTRDPQLTSLVVNAGITLRTVNFRVFCTGTVTNNGIIDNSGGAAAAGVAGVNPGSSSFPAGRSGGAGGTGVSGAGAVGVSAQWGNTGGAGGAGTSGGSGAGGTAPVSAVNAQVNVFATPYAALVGAGEYGFNPATGGGPGGGGGGSDAASNAGGGGGAGGGILVIFANVLTNNGTVTARGGAGAAGTGGNAGGGGGGTGGAVLIYTSQAAGGTGSYSVTGGALGAGSGTGSPGTAGGAGILVQSVL